MKVLKYDVIAGGIKLYESDLDLEQTLDCGQAFRWEKTDENTFEGAYLNYPLKVSQNGNEFIFHNISEDEFLNIWVEYFDLYTDYAALKNKYCEDEMMKKACSYAQGIRILKQDSFEALISFIFSQNNNIKRIKGIIKRLCEHYGGFPTAKDLAACEVEDLEFLRSGFRAKYVIDAARKVLSGEIDLEKIKALDYDTASLELQKIKGVGPKVADCVLLFGMYKIEAFPKDVWIKRAMAEYYPQGLPQCILGTQGIAQQYLFHYIRNNAE